MIKKIFAALALISLSSSAFASSTGVLDSSDPTWDGCGSSGTVGCYYDVWAFTVDADGLYTFTTEYAGDVPTDMNLDGYIRLFANAFDAGNPGSNIAFDDDYTDTGGFPSCVGQNCSQIAGVALTAGTSYFLAVTSFTNAPTSFGLPTGPWDLTVTGPGNVNKVPLPAAIWLLASGLLGFGFLRRRS